MFSFLFGSVFGILGLCAVVAAFMAGRQVERKGWMSLLKWRNWRTAADDCLKLVTK